MNYRELIHQLTPQVGAGEARAIVRLIMEERFGLSQTDLLLGKDTNLSADEHNDFEKIAFRLLQGEPVQYVLGFADFCGHRFRVTPAVLIPRPETEELVQWAIEDFPDTGHQSSINILDLCTGSGCIATSLALAHPEAHVTAIDISEEALVIARQNAYSLGAKNVEFFRQDVLGDYSLPVIHSPLSVIISNPPYVRKFEAEDMTPTVLNHEPHIALFVPDNDPLRFYRAIASIARRTLLPGGRLFLEINANLSEESRHILAASDFQDIQLHHDQFGRPRMLRATHKA